jgi:ATP-binding cassette, subfamily G (WHITE), member 2, SNQ2
VTGSILFNNQAPTPSTYLRTGFVEQLDLLEPFSTVKESLQFSARLKRDRNFSAKPREEEIDYMLELLDLKHFGDAIIGTPENGLGLEQRKRVAIACELISQPTVLFLDEP